MLSLDNFYDAQQILAPIARKTAIIHSQSLGLHLKTENLQLTGSFKLRGAYYKMSKLPNDTTGVVACSAGNHAQGVALAAREMNIPCTIFMPDGAPLSKVAATEALGATIKLVPGGYDDAYQKAIVFQTETGATLIHPFDDQDVIAGQGTIGLEILEQLSDIDAIVVPIGGGGLIAGVARAVKLSNPNIKIYGVQAENAASMLESNLIHDIHVQKSNKMDDSYTFSSIPTFADGIAVKKPGTLTLEYVQQHVDAIVTVSDDEIAAAVLRLMERQKLVCEGAGAVSVAAYMADKLPKHDNTVCILSGGNIDVNILSRVITRGLVTNGRKATLKIALEDKPGQLLGVSRVVAECGGNVISVDYSGSDPDMAITSCFLTIGLETKDFSQIDAIRTALSNAGLVVM